MLLREKALRESGELQKAAVISNPLFYIKRMALRKRKTPKG